MRKKSTIPWIVTVIRMTLLQATLVLMLTGISLAHANDGQAVLETRVTVTYNDTPVKKILMGLEKAASTKFAYSGSFVNLKEKTTLQVINARLGDVLDKLLKPRNIRYAVQNDFIILTQTANKKITITTPDRGKDNTVSEYAAVSGVVREADGTPLPGVSVIEKGTTNGTSSDAEGRYALNVSTNATLVFSFIGYGTVEALVDNRTAIDITLNPSIESLQEVVVMGYTTVKKKDVTGAVSSLAPELLTRVQNNNVTSALVGIAGIRVTGNDVGDIRIRGNRSIQANNAPLLIVDGVPYYGSLNTIDQNDIASIDVLKDASSAALYGSRGANGVIIITTKKGVKDKPRITFDSYTGIGVYSDGNLHNLNATEYIQFKRDANRAVGIWTSEEDDYKIFSSVELDKLGQVDNNFYQDYVNKNGFQTNNTLSYASGNEHGQQKISLNYLNNNARGKGMGNYDRFILSTANDYQAGKKVSLGLSSRLSYEKNFPGPSNFGSQLFRFIPTVDLYDDEGKLIAFPIGDSMLKNPYLDLNTDANDGESTAYEAFLKAYINYEIVKGLTLKSNFSADQVFTDAGTYIDDRAASYAESLNQATASSGRISRLAWNTMLNYNRTFGNHNVDAFGVFEIQENKQLGIGTSGSDQALAQYKWHNIGALTQNKALSSDFTRSQQISYVGRLQYGFKQRYILTGTIRYDGASQLAPRDRWDLFPSVGAAWNISDEDFMAAIPTITNLKLRGSYGITGNNAIAPYATYGAVLSRYTIFSSSGGGDKPYPTLEPDQMGVETLRWEKTKMANIGLDFGVLNQRITGTVDFYRSNTYDLLNRRKLPYTTGFNNVWDNIGTSRNTGFEITLNASVIERNSWTWKTTLSFYHNKEELTELYDPRLDKDIQNGWWIGYPVNGVYFDYRADGIWQLDETNVAAVYGRTPGEIKVRDITGDGAITGDDRQIIGTERPTLQSSMISTITYKNFDLMFDIYSEWGAIAYDDWSTGIWAFDMGRFNAPRLDYWTPENPSNTTPQPLAGHSGIDYMSSLGYHSNDFVRLRNITLGYTLKPSILPGIQKLRLYTSATNPARYWKFTREGGLSSREVVYNFGVNVVF